MNTRSRLNKIIAMGQRAFVLRYGVGRFGLTAALMTVGLEWLFTPELTLTLVLPPLVVFPLFGIVVGGMMWSHFQWKYFVANSEESR